MSQPSRPWASSPLERRKSRKITLDPPVPLEMRRLLAPYVATYPLVATFTAAATPSNTDLGTVVVSENTAATTPLDSAAPITSVSELTPISSFGNDIVTIAAGPGGVFGNDVYAISRGAGDNATSAQIAANPTTLPTEGGPKGGGPGAVNQPGIIYRVDPATGQSSVFFDLNSVMSQIDPAAPTAANSMGASTGLVNWYSITFDSEGTFNGTPAMFVASVDRSDPNKNVIFEIAPNGQLIGVFTQMTDGFAAMKFNLNPTAILMVPVQDQAFLSGLIAGSGESISYGGTWSVLYFQSSAYSPGQVISNSTLPTGVSQTDLGLPTIAATALNQTGTVDNFPVDTGLVVGLTASNSDYSSPIYSAFTDFGTGTGGGIGSAPGYSGVQGLDGGLLINDGTNTPTTADGFPAATTPFRRFESIAFDQYGYFSQSVQLTPASTTTNGFTTTTFTVTNPPTDGGSLFVSDLATGLYVTVTPIAPLPTTPIVVPVQGSGTIGVTSITGGSVYPIIQNYPGTMQSSGNSTASNVGGRIIRILPDGLVEPFALGFATNGAQNYNSFLGSSLTISFSADGTTLYASDDQGIWQFKTTASLADSTSGTLVGLNDLRTLGVPYDGQGSAVAVVDTGVDGSSPPFRGRVAPGIQIFDNGLGNQDLAAFTGGGTSAAGGNNTVLANTFDGHGTPVAGVIAQFVPQATIVPVNVFVPHFGLVSLSSSTTSAGGGVGGGGTGTTGATLSAKANALSDSNLVYNGLQYVVLHPYVEDPVRPGKVDRVIAASFAFGTAQTFQTEVDAYHNYPQVVIALKNEYHKFLKEGIAPIAAAGEFGAPLGTGSSTGTGTTSSIIAGDNNSNNEFLGDVNGMALPAVLNEVISVTGVYSFPYNETAASTPVDEPIGVIPNPIGPVLLFGNQLTIGGGATRGTGGAGGGGAGGRGGGGGGGGGGGVDPPGTGANLNANLLANADFELYANRVAAGVNRSDTTDFAAPAFNVPTFRRTFSPTTTGSASSAVAGDPLDHMTFTQVGTSMSAAIVTGAYALVSSALNYWTTIAQSNGYVDDAYLTTPVGVDSLNFGPHAFKNLAAWNNPSGINGILAWTAVPATDANDGGSLSTPPYLPGNTQFRSYASVNVSNAIAAIEGYVAINYLLKHHVFPIIDSNHDGVITAEELQTFVNNSTSMGMPEAGSMAALLGGTATSSAVQPGLNNEVFNENPDDPGAEQRRFNFFNYAVDGELTGGITVNQYKMLARILLPSPDAYTVTDRQRASANGFLLAPTTLRNFVAIQHIQPSFLWVPPSAVKKYNNISPARFKVGRNLPPGTYFPLYTLFTPTDPTSGTPDKAVVSSSTSATVNGVPITVDWLSYIPQPNTSSTSPATASQSTPYVQVTPDVKPASQTPAQSNSPMAASSHPSTSPSATTSTPSASTQATPMADLVALLHGTTSTTAPVTSSTGTTTTASATPMMSPITATSTASTPANGTASTASTSAANSAAVTTATGNSSTSGSTSTTTSGSTTATPSDSAGTGTTIDSSTAKPTSTTATSAANSAAATTPPPAAAPATKKAKDKKSSKKSSGFFNSVWNSVSSAFK